MGLQEIIEDGDEEISLWDDEDEESDLHVMSSFSLSTVYQGVTEEEALEKNKDLLYEIGQLINEKYDNTHTVGLHYLDRVQKSRNLRDVESDDDWIAVRIKDIEDLESNPFWMDLDE